MHSDVRMNSAQCYIHCVNTKKFFVLLKIFCGKAKSKLKECPKASHIHRGLCLQKDVISNPKQPTCKKWSVAFKVSVKSKKWLQ